MAAAITAGWHFARGGAAGVKRSRAAASATSSCSTVGHLVINGSMDLVFESVPAGHRGRPRRYEPDDPRAGHLSNVDKPEAFTGLIEEFVTTLPE